MRITRLKATNFKGLSFEEFLSPATVYVGDNYSGKTARLDLVRFVLTGYLGELGKRNSDTFALSSGREMIGEVELDDGRVLRRRLFAKGNSVSEEVNVPDEFEGSTLIPIMLDATEYFGLSETERVAYVFRNCPAVDLDISLPAVRRRLEKVEALPSGKKVIEAIFGKIDVTPGATPTDVLDALVDVATDEAKGTREQARRMEQTLQGLSGLRAADDTAPTVEVNTAALGSDLSRLSTRIAELGAAADRLKRAGQRRAEIERTLAGKDELDRQIAALQAEIDRHPTVGIEETDAAARLVEQLAAQGSNLANEVKNLGRQATEAGNRVIDLETELSTLDQKMECPFCGASGDGWKALKAAELATKIDEQKAAESGFVKAKTDEEGRLAEARATYTAAKERSGRLQGQERERARLLREITPLQQARARLEPLAEELDHLGDPTDPAVAAEEAKKLTAEADVIQTKLINAQETNRLAAQRTADRKRLAQAEEQRDAAKAELEAVTAAADALRDLRAEAVDLAFQPMLEDANRFAARVLSTPLAYNRERGELGTVRAGVWVSHRVFSGTEKAVAYAAIQAALAARAPLRLMVVDELGRLRDKHVRALISAACQAITAGQLDQFIGVDIAEPGTPRHRLYTEAAASDSRFHLAEVSASTPNA